MVLSRGWHRDPGFFWFLVSMCSQKRMPTPIAESSCFIIIINQGKKSVPNKSLFRPQASRSKREYSYVLNMVSRLIPPICGWAVMGTGNVRVTAYENPKWTPTYTLISLNCSYKHIYSRHHHTNTSRALYLIRANTRGVVALFTKINFQNGFWVEQTSVCIVLFTMTRQ